jgi:hypothetical protein
MTAFSLTAFAQNIDLMPGLYKVSSKIIVDGKSMDQSAEFKKMMEQQSKAMTPEMIKQMKSLNIEMPKMPNLNEMQICITSEDLNKDAILKSQAEQSCEYKVVKFTNKEMQMNIKCADGSDTLSTTKIINNKKYTAHNVIKSKKKGDAKLTEMNTEGNWVSAKCTKESLNQKKGMFN